MQPRAPRTGGGGVFIGQSIVGNAMGRAGDVGTSCPSGPLRPPPAPPTDPPTRRWPAGRSADGNRWQAADPGLPPPGGGSVSGPRLPRAVNNCRVKAPHMSARGQVEHSADRRADKLKRRGDSGKLGGEKQGARYKVDENGTRRWVNGEQNAAEVTGSEVIYNTIDCTK